MSSAQVEYVRRTILEDDGSRAILGHMMECCAFCTCSTIRINQDTGRIQRVPPLCHACHQLEMWKFIQKQYEAVLQGHIVMRTFVDEVKI